MEMFKIHDYWTFALENEQQTPHPDCGPQQFTGTITHKTDMTNVIECSQGPAKAEHHSKDNVVFS